MSGSATATLRAAFARADAALGRVEFAVAWACMVAIVGSLGAGVVFRGLLDQSLAWTGELGVLALVWLTFLGGSALYKRRGHMAVDAVSMLLAPRARRILAASLVALAGATVALVGWHVVRLIGLQHAKPIPGLDLPRSVYGVPVLWMCASMLLTSIRFLIDPPPDAEPDLAAAG